ncbi:MAG: porin family protein [Pseudomonadales bacterium]|nr:porin family protein [Pseudomonadales bacterium]
MKFKSLAVCAVSIIALSSSVQAEEVYGGVAINSFGIDVGGGDELSPTSLSGRIGTYLAPNIALELHVGIGIDKDDMDVNNLNTSVEIDKYWGTYIRPEFTVAEGIKAYGLFGYADVDAISGFNQSEIDVDDHGISYGIGAEFAFTPLVSGSIEYMQLLDGDKIDTSSLGLGVNVKF